MVYRIKINSISLLLLPVILLMVLVSSTPLSAAVSGTCSNCHTMHNSQDGSAVKRDGAGTGWDGSGQLTGGSLQSVPGENLLVTDCVGCHSSSTGQTIINSGGSRIPIVFNTSGYPVNPLAAGNFYYVSQGGAEYDKYGHNVYGISDVDNNLNMAPGNISCGGSDFIGISCHYTLAAAPAWQNNDRGGCRGCHYSVYHHNDNQHYRFLNSHEGGASGQAHVEGIEDPDWEQSPSQSNHNMYKGYDGPLAENELELTPTISTFCGGCHREFHISYDIGDASPWLRHPTDITLPTTGEYSAYDPVSIYSNEAPVAYIDPGSPSRATAVVMCLSCHRAHGSDQPDILRWDYSTIIAGGGGSGGCFTCHTTKN